MNDHLSALRLFVRVAHRGSFSAGGRELNVPQPTVSRLIAQLERELGAALFTRTTRAISLTDVGSDFLARVEPLLAELDEAETAARGSDELRGVLRVGVSSTFALREIVPLLPLFMDKHPKLRVELISSDQRQDFVSEGVDVGMRFGPLPDSTATAKRMMVVARGLFASPSYLSRAGVPASPADLAQHSVIIAPSRLGQTWAFRKGGEVVEVQVRGRLVVTFNEIGIAAAVTGLGIVAMTVPAPRKEVEAGLLTRILPDWDMGQIELHAVFPAGKAAKPAARAFVQFLAEVFASDPALR